jgi:hypothetical protein
MALLASFSSVASLDKWEIGPGSKPVVNLAARNETELWTGIKSGNTIVRQE